MCTQTLFFVNHFHLCSIISERTKMMTNYLFFNKQLLTLCLFIIILGTAPTKAFSKIYKHDFDIPGPPFDYKFDKRGKWCDKQVLIDNTTLNITHALKGETISVCLPRKSALINFQEDGKTIDPSYPGLMINLLNIVAKRGEFEWKFGFVAYDEILASEEMSVTDFILWSAENFDVVANWWYHLPSRVESGLAFPKGWYDGNVIVIAPNRNVDQFHLFSWGLPFSTGVWILLVITLVVSGILCYFLEKGLTMPKLNSNELSRISTDITDHIYMSSMLFTGHMNLKAKTKPGQLVSFSLSMFAMLMLSAYTANLASFLVTKNIRQTEVQGVDDIVDMGKSMCITDAAKKEAIIALQSIRKDSNHISPIFDIQPSEEAVLEGLEKGDCDYAISGVSTWDEIKDKDRWSCKMHRVGEIYQYIEAGFTMKSDSSVYCTSLVRGVFNFHLLQLQLEGEIQNQWDIHLKRNRNTTNCSENDSMDDLQILNLNNMGGIFTFHLSLLVIAFICSIGGKLYNQRCQQTLIHKQFTENIDNKNETVTQRFYSFAPSVGLRASMLEDLASPFPIDEDSSAANKEVLGNNFNNVREIAVTKKMYTQQSERIDDLATNMNELTTNMKKVIQKLDKITSSEDRDDSSLPGARE